MVETVQIKWMICAVIVLPDTQGKTLPSVRKMITPIIKLSGSFANGSFDLFTSSLFPCFFIFFLVVNCLYLLFCAHFKYSLVYKLLKMAIGSFIYQFCSCHLTPPPVFIVTQILITVPDRHARMVEIVQMKWMISVVIVLPDIQAKTVLSGRKNTFIINYFWPSQLVFFLMYSFLVL